MVEVENAMQAGVSIRAGWEGGRLPSLAVVEVCRLWSSKEERGWWMVDGGWQGGPLAW